jgi:hypothetical protein
LNVIGVVSSHVIKYSLETSLRMHSIDEQ